MADRSYDVVLYGATGFVGSRAAAYLFNHPQQRKFRFAIAGRDRSKLEAVRRQLGDKGASIDTLVADSADLKAIDAMVRRAAVLINTAGPFALYGNAIVDACVRRKTHYVDITGETVWVRSLIDRHHTRAAADGTRIVPCCGFDSVPSDIGSLLVARCLQQSLKVPCVEVKAYFQMYGGFNGGTIASDIHRHETGDIERGRDPFLLNPGDAHSQEQIEQASDPRRVVFDKVVGTWVGPFIMGPINTRVVRRSAALFAQWREPYGPGFRYQEYTKFDPPAAHLKATIVHSLMAGFEGAMTLDATRALLKKVLPKPGAGPSEKTMAAGWFTTELIGQGADGRCARVLMRHEGDPANRATLKFVCESALCLALDTGELPGGAGRGGVLTPATALGDVLVRRVRAADTSIEVSG